MCFPGHVVGLQQVFLELNYSGRPSGNALIVVSVRLQNKWVGNAFCQASLSDVLSGILIIIQEQQQ